MRRAITIVTLCILVGLYSIPAWADSPHYLKSDASFSTNTACYSLAIKEAGLGNSGVTSVTYSLTCSANFESVCVTRNGKNFVQGQPKSGSGTATVPTTLPIRNGSTTGTLSLCPANFTLPDPGCTGSQRLFIIFAEYSGCTLDDGLLNGAESPLDVSETLGGDVFVQVP